MESPLPPRHVGFDTNTPSARPRGLVRKSSKLQTHVEVLKCRLGKPAASPPETDPSFGPSKQWTPIYYAVHHQREAALTHFLQNGSSPDDVEETGQPPICIAIANGCMEIARILLEAGADINASMKDSGETALHIAIKNGQADLIDLVLRHEPELECHTIKTGDTPLHYAASKSTSLAVVVNLLKLGARYDSLNDKHQTPAEAALLANNIQGAIAIVNAAHGKRKKLVKEKEMLLKHVERSQNKFSIGNELIADIFSAACDPDSTVLVEAIKRNDAGLVEMFLEKGADPDRPTAKGLQPIFVALECAKASVVQALVKHNADVTARDVQGLTVLQAAFEGSHAQDKEAMSAIFECLLSHDADATVTYPNGQTLLHRAVSLGYGHTRVAQLLLSHGVKVNAQDNAGNTALHLATHNKSCMDVLLRSGAKPDRSNFDGLTPLLYAVTNTKRTNEPDFDHLVKVSDLRRANVEGQTPLHLAAWNGLEKTIRLLLRARAETTIVDSNKNTPLFLAVLNHQWHVVPLLTIPPSINSWDEEGLTALHHIVTSTPKSPSTWADIASATVPFCERGVSRSMRDRSGATPLISAIRVLPEDGLPVIEALLVRTNDRTASWNCVSHEDHSGNDALYYAVINKKAIFVDTLLKYGATFTFKDWVPGKIKGDLSPETDKRISKLLAQYEWSRRAGSLRRQSATPDSEAQESLFASMFPIKDIKSMLSMGLEVNALPKTSLGSSMLWAILRQIPLQPPLAPAYLFDAIKLILDHSADPNVGTARGGRRSPSPQASAQDLPLSLHTLTFLLEEYSTVDVDLVTLLLTKGTKLSIASPFYGGRYPLHSATKANRIDLVDEFLLQRADVNCIDRDGRAPLFIAAEKGFWEIVDTLVRRGAKLDIEDGEKNTALHAAAVGGRRRIIAALLRAGAKAGAKNARGQTPLGCVPDDLESKEKDKVIRMLKDCEDKEARFEERDRKLAEQAARHDAQLKLRREEEAKLAKDRLAKAQEEKEAKAKQLSKKPDKLEKSRQVSSPLPEKPRTKSSIFRTPSLLSPRPKITPVPSETMPVMPKQMLELRIHTPPSTTHLKSLSPKSPTTQKSPSTAPLKEAKHATPINANTSDPNTTTQEKRVTSPRIDSGFGQKRASITDKPLPVLDRNKTTLSDDDAVQRNSNGAELADWLALSKMMDNL